ncbi:hypothetical protein EC9_00860 [Rosistilla ulvae]|uniref:Uncharacterized protein n=1 Tax=Rosistilla ulvae TaxID=1930277 RepID=A0A517LTI1_9BACT|nr:hypothetical protein EC9_00860 [Rosistilla ulvae]
MILNIWSRRWHPCGMRSHRWFVFRWWRYAYHRLIAATASQSSNQHTDVFRWWHYDYLRLIAATASQSSNQHPGGV